MIKRRIKKKYLRLQKHHHVFSLKNSAVLLFCIFVLNAGHSQTKINESYPWLYNLDGNLIAETSISIDPSIASCKSGNTSKSFYLFNRITLLNRINPTIEMITTGQAPSLILMLYLKKIDIATFKIYDLALADSSQKHLQEYVPLFMEQLVGTDLFGICGGDYIYIHLPVKFEINNGNLSGEAKITKSIKDGWFLISTDTNFFINN